MTAGRPRQHATNAEKQRAYRERAKQPKALRNSLGEIQAAINAHHSPGFWNDPSWIARSTELFDQLIAARRALLGVKVSR